MPTHRCGNCGEEFTFTKSAPAKLYCPRILAPVVPIDGPVVSEFSEYNPRLTGRDAAAAQADPAKPAGACCNDERRGMNGGCANCGDPCL